MRILVVLLLVLSLADNVLGQASNFNNMSRNWSKNKKEILFGFGATNFLGDLGGKNRIGTDYSLVDLDLPATSWGVLLGYRYRYRPRFATTTMVNFGRLRGNDAFTQEVIRRSRNLHFRSPILSISQRLEWIVYANEQIGGRYRIPGIRRMPDRNNQFYLFGGVGLAYFNPKAKYQNQWIALRPLSTEGQGLDGGPDPYKRYTLIIPMGAGLRFALGKQWRLGLEATFTMTFSDYIDDVHGVYYDRNSLQQQKGSEAAYFSNPAFENAHWFSTNMQRGDEQRDSYVYLNVVLYRNVTYKVFDGGRFQGGRRAPKGRRYKF